MNSQLRGAFDLGGNVVGKFDAGRSGNETWRGRGDGAYGGRGPDERQGRAHGAGWVVCDVVQVMLKQVFLGRDQHACHNGEYDDPVLVQMGC